MTMGAYLVRLAATSGLSIPLLSLYSLLDSIMLSTRPTCFSFAHTHLFVVSKAMSRVPVSNLSRALESTHCAVDEGPGPQISFVAQAGPTCDAAKDFCHAADSD